MIMVAKCGDAGSWTNAATGTTTGDDGRAAIKLPGRPGRARARKIIKWQLINSKM